MDHVFIPAKGGRYACRHCSKDVYDMMYVDGGYAPCEPAYAFPDAPVVPRARWFVRLWCWFASLIDVRM